MVDSRVTAKNQAIVGLISCSGERILRSSNIFLTTELHSFIIEKYEAETAVSHLPDIVLSGHAKLEIKHAIVGQPMNA
ncbi:hypothetical protein NQU17_06005 [Clostridiaceae bacterium HFYG-1003]|nr:hypothetical protein NQU17_06005 [Clostridiaceae bacterium HFYG-1003]